MDTVGNSTAFIVTHSYVPWFEIVWVDLDSILTDLSVDFVNLEDTYDAVNVFRHVRFVIL